MGDHGYHLGEHGWWNKVTIFELGARTPLIAWVPGAKAMGAESQSIVELLDLYPTLVAYCGIEPPHQLTGQSLRPILDSAGASGLSKPAFTQVTRGGIGMGYSVRTERYRLIRWGREGEGGTELYEHPEDPEEYHNLAENPDNAVLVRRLTKVLKTGFPSLN